MISLVTEVVQESWCYVHLKEVGTSALRKCGGGKGGKRTTFMRRTEYHLPMSADIWTYRNRSVLLLILSVLAQLEVFFVLFAYCQSVVMLLQFSWKCSAIGTRTLIGFVSMSADVSCLFDLTKNNTLGHFNFWLRLSLSESQKVKWLKLSFPYKFDRLKSISSA